MDGKEQILNGLTQVYEAWQARLADLDEETIMKPEFLGEWSIKDVVAHLWSWQQVSIARMRAALSGTEPSYPAWREKFDPDLDEDVERANAWLYEASRDKPWSQVYHEWSEQFRQYIELAHQVAEEDLLALGRYTWMGKYALAASAMGTLEHHAEHLEILNNRLLEHEQG